ncbi:MAG: hypothetical protein H9W81_12845 [Enterococcus sp.]|nr:hypothetical protein [Enterococcus sp.]
MPLGKLKPMTPRSGAGAMSAPERVLMSKYGFDLNQAKSVALVFDNQINEIKSFASMSLHIKGMGFLRNEIVELVELFQHDALDLANWRGVKGMTKHLNSMRLVYLAYSAGLTAEDVELMSESDLSEETLSTMASLRAI